MHSRAARIAIRMVTIVLAIVATGWLVWMPWIANIVLSQVEARSKIAMNADSVTTAVLARRNIAELRRIRSVTQDDANYYMLYAANAALLNELDEAARQYTAALTHADHRPEIYYERGIIYFRMGKVDAAVRDLARAAKFDPSIVDSVSGDLRQRVREAAALP